MLLFPSSFDLENYVSLTNCLQSPFYLLDYWPHRVSRDELRNLKMLNNKTIKPTFSQGSAKVLLMGPRASGDYF